MTSTGFRHHEVTMQTPSGCVGPCSTRGSIEVSFAGIASQLWSRLSHFSQFFSSMLSVVFGLCFWKSGRVAACRSVRCSPWMARPLRQLQAAVYSDYSNLSIVRRYYHGGRGGNLPIQCEVYHAKIGWRAFFVAHLVRVCSFVNTIAVAQMRRKFENSRCCCRCLGLSFCGFETRFGLLC